MCVCWEEGRMCCRAPARYVSPAQMRARGVKYSPFMRACLTDQHTIKQTIIYIAFTYVKTDTM